MKIFVSSALCALLIALSFGLSGAQAHSFTTDHLASNPEVLYKKLATASDPRAAYLNLADDEREVFDNYFLPASMEQSITIAEINSNTNTIGEFKEFKSEATAAAVIAASSSCWVGRTKYTAKAALGNALWDTWTEGRWCSSGGKITSARFSRSWATIAAIGWRDAGQIGRGSGISKNQARIWSQRRMVFGTGGWDLQTIQPCNRLNGNTSGKVTLSTICSIV